MDAQRGACPDAPAPAGTGRWRGAQQRRPSLSIFGRRNRPGTEGGGTSEAGSLPSMRWRCPRSSDCSSAASRPACPAAKCDPWFTGLVGTRVWMMAVDAGRCLGLTRPAASASADPVSRTASSGRLQADCQRFICCRAFPLQKRCPQSPASRTQRAEAPDAGGRTMGAWEDPRHSNGRTHRSVAVHRGKAGFPPGAPEQPPWNPSKWEISPFCGLSAAPLMRLPSPSGTLQISLSPVHAKRERKLRTVRYVSELYSAEYLTTQIPLP